MLTTIVFVLFWVLLIATLVSCDPSYIIMWFFVVGCGTGIRLLIAAFLGI